MDKINSANWSNVFANTKQQVMFASDRYSDIHFRFEEPGLASGFIQSVSTPGMRLTQFSMSAGKPVMSAATSCVCSFLSKSISARVAVLSSVKLPAGFMVEEFTCY